MPATDFRLIQPDVWRYVRFTLSYRDVEDLLAKRRLIVNNESIRLRRLRLALGGILMKWRLNRWTAKVYVACCRQRSQGSRDPGPAPTRQGCCGAAAADTASTSGLRS